MAIGLSILALAAAVFFLWQKFLPNQTAALLNQAEEAHKRHDLSAAENACLRALASAQRTWLANAAGSRVIALYNLAVLYLEQGKPADAENIALKALAVSRTMGRKSPVSLSLVTLMARIYKRLDKDLSACPIFQLSIPMLTARHGPDSLQVGAALHEMGVTYSRIGVPERAIEPLQKCIPIFQKRLGADHRDVASAFINLGRAQSDTKEYADAEQSYRTAIALLESASGPDDPQVALVLNNLAVNYKKQDRIPEALECLHRALAIREAKLGPNHPQVGIVLINLSNCLRIQQKYDEAETAIVRAKAILENPQHQSFAIALDSFATLRAAQRRYEEADQLFVQCIKIHESRPSSNLIDLAETCERYADVLYKLQREHQANALLDKVSSLRAAREKIMLLPAVPAA